MRSASSCVAATCLQASSASSSITIHLAFLLLQTRPASSYIAATCFRGSSAASVIHCGHGIPYILRGCILTEPASSLLHPHTPRTLSHLSLILPSPSPKPNLTTCSLFLQRHHLSRQRSRKRCATHQLTLRSKRARLPAYTTSRAPRSSRILRRFVFMPTQKNDGILRDSSPRNRQAGASLGFRALRLVVYKSDASCLSYGPWG